MNRFIRLPSIFSMRENSDIKLSFYLPLYHSPCSELLTELLDKINSFNNSWKKKSAFSSTGEKFVPSTLPFCCKLHSRFVIRSCSKEIWNRHKAINKSTCLNILSLLHTCWNAVCFTRFWRWGIRTDVDTELLQSSFRWWLVDCK